MTTTLRLIVDQLIAPVPGPTGRYTHDLANALVATAPRGCEVEGIVSSSLPREYDAVLEQVPGLARLYKTSLARRDLAAAWQLGLTTSPGGGIIHGTTLFAPLRRHDRAADGTQIVVTVHDLVPWRHPESVSAASAAWHKGMLKRARKHADAVVVPTHALAEELADLASFGDRIRVIGTAPRSGLVVPPAAERAARAARLGLPSAYVLVAGTLEPRRGLVDVLAALGRPDVPDVPVVVIGPESWGEQHLAPAAEELGVAPARLHRLDDPEPADLAVALAGAMAYLAPAHDAGSGTDLIEAFSVGTPVIHSDVAAYREISAGAGHEVALDGDGYPERLADALAAVLGDRGYSERLSIAGRDRARAFSWRDAGERVWQLHADL